MLLRTFLDVFPYATGWVDGSFVIGSKTPYTIDRELIAQRLNGSAGEATRRIGLPSVESVLHLFSARDDELRAFAGSGPVVSDDHPYVEFFRSLPHDPSPADTSHFSKDPSPLLR
jgi:hypothetical protein